MDNAEVFRTIALAFAAPTSTVWQSVTASGTWASFIDGVRRLMGSTDSFGARQSTLSVHPNAPLQEVLTEQEVRALFVPPEAQSLQSFARRHFVGGLPNSAVPVESLYVPWARSGETSLTHSKGHYQSSSFLYMRDLLASLGLETPDEFAGYPDHLVVQLEVLAFLMEEGEGSNAAQFFLERFSWLSDYRPRLVALGSEAHFHLALVDILLAIHARQNREGS